MSTLVSYGSIISVSCFGDPFIIIVSKVPHKTRELTGIKHSKLRDFRNELMAVLNRYDEIREVFERAHRSDEEKLEWMDYYLGIHLIYKKICKSF